MIRTVTSQWSKDGHLRLSQVSFGAALFNNGISIRSEDMNLLLREIVWVLWQQRQRRTLLAERSRRSFEVEGTGCCLVISEFLTKTEAIATARV